MTPSLLIRPVLGLAFAASLSACGMVENDPHRFENLANAVAAIPLGAPTTDTPAVRTAAQAGLRPALHVEVMEPHALWDARDGDLRAGLEDQAGRAVAAAAPAMAEAVVQTVSARIDGAAARAGLRPAQSVRTVSAPGSATLVQIGAYSSDSAARAAWTRLKTGGAAMALDGLSPVYEGVEVGGRRLVRLKVRAPVTGAAAVCAAAGINDPWCHRAA